MILLTVSVVISSAITIMYWRQTVTTLAALTLSSQKIWEGFDVAEDVSSNVNGVYVVGWKFVRSRQTSEAVLAKYDREGNMIWNTTWMEEHGAHGRGISCSSDGIYVVGTLRNASYITYSYVMKFNDMGEQVWNKTWDTAREHSVYATDEAVYITGAGKLAKLDAYGNQLWERTVSGSALEVTSDRIYIAGSTGKEATGGSDAFLAALDPEGNQIWNTTRESTRGDTATDVCVTQDGVYIIGTGTKGWNFNFITKFDLDGNQLWDKVGGRFRGISFYQGYIYAVGSTGDEPSAFDAFIAQLDKEGNVIWNTTFGTPDREDNAHGVHADAEGVYVVGTTESDTLWPDRRGFLQIYKKEK